MAKKGASENKERKSRETPEEEEDYRRRRDGAKVIVRGTFLTPDLLGPTE